MTTAVIPGQVLGDLTTHQPGPGTHVYENNIYASVGGILSTAPPAPSKSTSKTKPTLSVPRAGTSTAAAAPPSTLPRVSSVVLCRVLRVQRLQLSASILLVDPDPHTVLPYPVATDDERQFQAILRKEDVRAYEKDKVVMNDMYRVGDVVRAAVISLGDERSYYVSTSGNDLGVVVARSEVGNALVPSSWRDMRDVVTGKAESRKVAKPA